MSDLLGPQQVVLITARAHIEQLGKKVEKDDIETVFWHMPVSQEEMLYAVAVHNGKHIGELIKQSGVFAVNFIPLSLEPQVHKCNALHGAHIDKFKELGFIKVEASHMEAPLIKEACGHLECHVKQTLAFADYTVFIAKIINSATSYTPKRLFHLKNNYYTTTKD